MIVSPSLFAGTGLVGTLGIQIIDPLDDSELLAHTTVGIVENPASSGVYYFRGTATDALVYVAVWDISGVVIAAEEVQVEVAGVLVPPIAGGVPAPGAFWIKRHDTREPLIWQAIDETGIVDISGSALLFKMRSAPNTGSLKVNKPAFIDNGVSGIMRYQWNNVGPFTDTDTAGLWDAEFEATFPDGRIKTFPTTTDPNAEYLQIHIVSDLDDA